MAKGLSCAVIVSLVLLAASLVDARGRLLMNTQESEEKMVKKIPSLLTESLVLSALPKGGPPPSGPGKGGNAVVVNGRLYAARHLTNGNHSPGEGH